MFGNGKYAVRVQRKQSRYIQTKRQGGFDHGSRSRRSTPCPALWYHGEISVSAWQSFWDARRYKTVTKRRWEVVIINVEQKNRNGPTPFVVTTYYQPAMRAHPMPNRGVHNAPVSFCAPRCRTLRNRLLNLCQRADVPPIQPRMFRSFVLQYGVAHGASPEDMARFLGQVKKSD